ncbi:glycogen synthase [Pseudothermotoga thermarum]|uniref:Glycogen synthase n=1 Tax=Pseudothermotoga thermarum DSM 5069 TaxID=688269 RepID=F7YXG4_9THEM|nr:glycogen/starch synthase [Pseudothermotoga thermarum]AEH51958.1 glycogen synthase (ADP-glucose) [Pseudothermotoga thermarum DSM 5069]
MRIAMAAFEVYPFAKVGGLADVLGSLPKVIEKQGEKVSIFMPLHKLVRKNCEKLGITLESLVKSIPIPYLQTQQKFDVYHSKLPGSNVPVYFIANDYYFSAENVYEAPDIAEQSIFFCASVLEAMKNLGMQFDIIHAHDWQTALIPVYLKALYRTDPFFSKTASVFTIHNLGYQGIFDPLYMKFAGLPNYLFSIDGLEFYGKLNFMKGGILFSDVITTVSPTYAQEIQTEEFGEKLDGVLRLRADDLYGILNGIDYLEYDPATDKRIYVNYDLNNVEKKKLNKLELQKALNLEADENKPMIGMINRLVDQKGLDLVEKAIDFIMLFDVQFVVLGTGEKKYEEMFQQIQEKYPTRVSVNLKFDVDLAQKIYAASDIFLMPSRYEPCGLGQMYSLRYGTIPVVRYTGGLADTVKEYNPKTKEGNGFGFTEYDPAHLLYAVAKAVHVYKNEKEHWNRLIKNAMQTDVSWERSAKQYISVYQEALKKKRF